MGTHHITAAAGTATVAASANSSYDFTITDRVVLPLPPPMGMEHRFEMDVYARFMRHLRQVPTRRMETKILSSIQFTADMMDVADALIAKTLTDLGLRAPRAAFPLSFLDFADRAAQRAAWDHGPPPASILSLRHHWDRIGEDLFVSASREHFAIYGTTGFATA